MEASLCNSEDYIEPDYMRTGNDIKRKSVGYAIAAIMVLISVYFIWRPTQEGQRNEHLYSTGVLIPALVTDVYVNEREKTLTVSYRIHVRQRWLESTSKPFRYSGTVRKEAIVGRYAIALVDSVHPGNSELFLSDRQFALYGKRMPDSLMWMTDALRSAD